MILKDQKTSSTSEAPKVKSALLDKYEEDYSLEKFDLLVDWGWFYFLTKPLFYALYLGLFY